MKDTIEMIERIQHDIAHCDHTGIIPLPVLVAEEIKSILKGKKDSEGNPWFCPECGCEYNDCCKEHIKRMEIIGKHPRKPRTPRAKMTNTDKANELSFRMTFHKEDPSLCDTCKRAYYMGGGIVAYGDKVYRQRYCRLTNKHGHGRAISGRGYQECEGYVET